MLPNRHSMPFVLGGIILVVVTIGLAIMVSRRTRLKVGTATPPNTLAVDERRFFVLGFPRCDDIYAERKSVSSRKLERAIILSLDELRAPHVTVFSEEMEVFVGVGDLTFVPPVDAEEFIAALNAKIAAWGDATDWRRVGVEAVEMSDTLWNVSFLLTDRRGRTREFRYVVESDGLPEPMEVRILR